MVVFLFYQLKAFQQVLKKVKKNRLKVNIM